MALWVGLIGVTDMGTTCLWVGGERVQHFIGSLTTKEDGPESIMA